VGVRPPAAERDGLELSLVAVALLVKLARRRQAGVVADLLGVIRRVQRESEKDPNLRGFACSLQARSAKAAWARRYRGSPVLSRRSRPAR
jgi:hypothetical protein